MQNDIYEIDIFKFHSESLHDCMFNVNVSKLIAITG